MGQDTQFVVWDTARLCSLLPVASGGKMHKGDSRGWGLHSPEAHSSAGLAAGLEGLIGCGPEASSNRHSHHFVYASQSSTNKSSTKWDRNCLTFKIPSQKLEPHFFFKKFYLLFNWRIIAFQNYAVFCQTSTWISHHNLTSDNLCWSKSSSKFSSHNSVELCPNLKGGDTDLSKNLQPCFEITTLYFCRGRKINTRCLRNLPKVIELS